MKTLIMTVLTLSFSSSLAFAKAEVSLQRSDPSVQQVVRTYNNLYQTLQLSVAKPAPEARLYEELEVLGDALNGENVPAGNLVHLACCHVSCGGGCGKK